MSTCAKISGILFAIIFAMVGAVKGVSGFNLFVLSGIGGGVGGLVGSFIGIFLDEYIDKAIQDVTEEVKTEKCLECKHYIEHVKCKMFPGTEIPSELQQKYDKPCEGSQGNKFAQIEWSKPMSKSEIMAAVEISTHEEFQEFSKLHRTLMVKQDELILLNENLRLLTPFLFLKKN